MSNYIKDVGSLNEYLSNLSNMPKGIKYKPYKPYKFRVGEEVKAGRRKVSARVIAIDEHDDNNPYLVGSYVWGKEYNLIPVDMGYRDFTTDVANSEFKLEQCRWLGEDELIRLIRLSNLESEEEEMENKELEKIGQHALNIIDGVRNYKIKLAESDYAKKHEEITKNAKVNELIEKHTKNLKNEISELLKREFNDQPGIYFMSPNAMRDIKFKIDDYLTDDEKNSTQELLIKLKTQKNKINKQFNNIVQSLHLCTTVEQVQEFLVKQGFVKNGLIVEPEKWEGQ